MPRQFLQLQHVRRRPHDPYFVWKRHRGAGKPRWDRWNPPWDSYEEASEAAYRMAGGGRSQVDPYFREKLAELYVGQASPVDRWGRYKTRALADQYSAPGRTDYVWIPGRDPDEQIEPSHRRKRTRQRRP